MISKSEKSLNSNREKSKIWLFNKMMHNKEMFYRKCVVCGMNRYKRLFVKEGFKFVKCNNCGFIYTNPSIKQKSLKIYYENIGEEYYQTPDNKTRDVMRNLLKDKFNDELSYIERYAKKGRVLDIGCGVGIFLYYAKKRGWKVYGTEFNKFSIKYINDTLKINTIFSSDLKKLEKNYFDLITLHQVMEHIPDPNKMLRDIRLLLRDDGLIFMSVPYVYGISTRIIGRNSMHYAGMGHLNYFNRKNMITLMNKNGFEVIKIRTEAFKADMLLDHFRRKLIKTKQDNHSNDSPLSLGHIGGFKIRVYKIICAILNAAYFGDYMTVLARKKPDK